MSEPTLCLYTQTPLLRFEPSVARAAASLSSYREDVDYRRSPGGVTRMVEPLLARLTATGRVASATWMSLAMHGPSRVAVSPRVEVEHVRLPPDDLAEYSAAKQALWEALHGLRFDLDTVALERGLDKLSHWLSLKTFRRPEWPYDLSYVHDFQLLPLAGHLTPGPPRVFRWHVPAPDPGSDAAAFAARHLNAYDAVIVSTRGYARRFRQAGVHVPLVVLHPFFDPSRASVVTQPDVAAFERRFGIGRRDKVFLVVARLDPMKSHDVALRAFARLRPSMPDAKLVFVGGGGFSAGRNGLGLTHSADFREDLERLARDLGVEEVVVFTGGIPDRDLDVAYTRADAVLLPSTVEGFGLVAVEGWSFGKPVVVSDGAGVAELVKEGQNGYTFPAGDDAALADRMQRALASPEHARRLGLAGRKSAEACHIERSADHVWDVLRGTLDGRRIRRAI